MKKILITQRLIKYDQYPEVREALDVEWGRFLSSVSVLPIAVPLKADVKDLFDEMDVSGVLLTGGNDISVVSNDPLSGQRDELEKKIMDEAIARNVPVLGVCRGMQFIAHYYGLSLNKIANHMAIDHRINFTEETKVFNAYDGQITVNSFHNFGISKESIEDNNDLVLAASAEDGSVEALEHKELPIVGMMWHPERNKILSSSDVNLFNQFFNRLAVKS